MHLNLYDSVPSTMEIAREQVVSGQVNLRALGEGAYVGVQALAQTAGRGQRGRQWLSPPGACLAATYYLPFERGLAEAPGRLALLAGVAAAEAVQESGLLGAILGLKWPNDLLLNGKKLGGVLIETAQTPQGEWAALVGIGLNVSVRAFPPELRETATSLVLEGVAPPSVESLGVQVAARLYALAAQRERKGFAPILRLWRTYDRTAGRRYRAQADDREIEGIALGVDPNGALQLRLANGETRCVLSATALREIER